MKCSSTISMCIQYKTTIIINPSGMTFTMDGLYIIICTGVIVCLKTVCFLNIINVVAVILPVTMYTLYIA